MESVPSAVFYFPGAEKMSSGEPGPHQTSASRLISVAQAGSGEYDRSEYGGLPVNHRNGLVERHGPRATFETFIGRVAAEVDTPCVAGAGHHCLKL
jgi:hypothetical protein